MGPPLSLCGCPVHMYRQKEGHFCLGHKVSLSGIFKDQRFVWGKKKILKILKWKKKKYLDSLPVLSHCQFEQRYEERYSANCHQMYLSLKELVTDIVPIFQSQSSLQVFKGKIIMDYI